ncbi:hypothetical protein PIB30_102584, partial [Stylosanthes scabra]|nr:hypothetical protein [Stylosanthes scabra]
ISRAIDVVLVCRVAQHGPSNAAIKILATKSFYNPLGLDKSIARHCGEDKTMIGYHVMILIYIVQWNDRANRLMKVDILADAAP